MTHTITPDAAYEIDLAWQNATNGDMLPRLVTYRNDTRLTIPSLNGSAPTYQYRAHDPETGAYAPAYYHIAGPTLDEWNAMQDARDAAETERDLLSCLHW